MNLAELPDERSRLPEDPGAAARFDAVRARLRAGRRSRCQTHDLDYTPHVLGGIDVPHVRPGQRVTVSVEAQRSTGDWAVHLTPGS
ncbi:hypothetical protein [Actinokineospora fastidiosa]|uniref:Uncharacterized protein n=1 Tax=Actinokineospora fastidiosa TaxID=1816 RepID=A0A918GB57_9PSEU|nr:hypothetical protein [Actinokineospora fastidiosa]GGS24424.1 hypothetical protein GCM10010171_16980 [Actinokineospora fastidiosa]